MKIDVIITIRDSSDPETALEVKFEECESEAVLANPDLALIHGNVKRFTEFFEENKTTPANEE